MALRRTLSKRLYGATTPDSPPQITTLLRSPAPPLHAAKANFRREFLTSPDSAPVVFFRRFLQRRAINNHSSPNALPSFLTLPVGEKLREKLKSINISGDDQRLRLDGLSPPLPTEEGFRVGAGDAKRVLRFVQMEKVREKLRNIPASTIPYGEYLRVCCDVCGNTETGLEFAKALDESGNVIVLGGVVFLRPDQVAKSMEELISQSIAMPNDPRRKELDNLEREKARIDKKARSIVRGELYCGLGFWTSKEPSFEGYFQRRFKLKQNKLMKAHNFDLERYNHLCEVFYREKQDNVNVVVERLDHVRGAVFGSVHG
ncbi:UNVERIFIED_CONTAM: Calcium uniporter protein 4, mitochondrial [Sesamum calycinum]|uniref:Calcium uniporter protein 4, mitochondrial n=1 Tax=Sesamum calycinum TaxID=2727403 RepID=A0AAW2P6H9_9LAMI